MARVDWPTELVWISSKPTAPAGRVLVVAMWSCDDPAAREVGQVLGWLALRFADRPLSLAAIHGRDPSAAERVRRATARLGLQVPVAVDLSGDAEARFGSGALPALFVAGADGQVRFRGPGVPDRERLSRAVGSLLDEAESSGAGGSVATSFVSAPQRVRSAELLPSEDGVSLRVAFPSGLAVDEDDGLLWIAESGPRPRLSSVELPASGDAIATLRHTVGGGRPGSADGDPSLVAFATPAGICCDAGQVFVADTGNHLVRAFDVGQYGVSTLLGTGRAVADHQAGGSGSRQGLAAPTDVAVLDDDRLVVAVAGCHQLWTVDRLDGRAEPLVGSGTPASTDGVRHDAGCTAPAAVAVDSDARLVAFVEPATGAVRVLEMDSEIVWSWVAAGGSLQAPCAVAWLGDDLLVADPPRGVVAKVRGRDQGIEVFAGPEQGLVEPVSLAVLPDGRVVVGDVGREGLLVFSEAESAGAELVIRDLHHELEDETPVTLVRVAANGGYLSLSFPLPMPTGEFLHPELEAQAWLLPEAAELLPPTAAATPMPVASQGEWGVLGDIELLDGEPGSGGVLRVLVRYVTCADPDGTVHLQEWSGAARLERDLDLDGTQFAELYGP